MILFFTVLAKGQNMNLLPDTFGICAGEIATLKIEKKLEKNATIIWFDTYAGFTQQQVLASQPYAINLAVLKPGKVTVKVIIGKNTYYDSTMVILNRKPVLSMRDSTYCKGRTFYLDAKNPGIKYQWSTGETTQKIKIENSGIYWVKLNNNGCVQYDTVAVKFVQGATPNFGDEVSFCLSDENKVLSIKTLPNTKIQWSTGSVYPSTNVTKEGVYWVKTENKSCGEQTDSVTVKLKACDCEMLIPNSFTPNEDNRNDYFFPVLQCEYSSFKMTIKDKWDNVVFITNSVNGKWDGRFKGNLCPEEVYIYEIESVEKLSGKKNAPRIGKVSLFR
ncbi:MAG TPA: gliding motility-associated C-terminal domain-containing protein [Bacteroidia bacterium]|nr:gliding motility-associated C-terminal domain-containing protein [Bacteroidia bacterium]